jgi:hypothetical protein
MCDAEPECRGFEYGVDYGGGTNSSGHCELKSAIDTTGCDGAAHDTDLYEKGYALNAKHPSSSNLGNCSSSSTWADGKGAACSDYHINAAAVRNTFDCAFSGKVMASCSCLWPAGLAMLKRTR